MIEGGCLCGAVRYRIRPGTGPLELCHCRLCRKASGSAAMANLAVRVVDIEWLSASDGIRIWQAPLREQSPAWRRCFCGTCGAPVPDPQVQGEMIEVPAGSLEGDPGARPARHIFVEHAPAWLPIEDAVPQCTAAEIRALRARSD